MITSLTLSERLQNWAQTHPVTLPPELQEIRESFTQIFPLARLPELTLDEYVIGHGDQNNYCYWLEQRTRKLGSIAGGAASKFGVYWSAKNTDYRFNAMFSSPEDTLRRILGGIVAGGEALSAGDVAATDRATAEAMGYNRYTMRLKALTLYFPEKLLPICNPEHLKHFLRALGQEPTGDQAALNVQLLDVLRAQPGAAGYDTHGLMRFLYSEFSPAPYIERTSSVKAWTIALGETASDLPDALEHGVIMIGPSVAYLGAHEPVGIPDVTGQSPGVADAGVAFAHRMKKGDVVVAHRGMRDIVAIGVIHEPYLAPDSAANPLTAEVLETRHPDGVPARHVRWLIRTPLKLPLGLKNLAMNTITALPEATLNIILAGYARTPMTASLQAALEELGWREHQVPADLAELLDLSELTRNIILYGPPGTGKTYTARRFADAFLRNQLRVSLAAESAQLAANPLARYLHLVTFHPAFSYEEFVEGLRPTADGRGLIVREGVFKRVCEAARNDPDNRYVLLIDEINRADTARTFGELITLIEDDKRAEPGVPARYEVSLPYSDPPANRFSVPENVHIIGTMNTADRSIALMDIALRRRFTFVEVPPVTEHLGTVDGLSLGTLLTVLNRRITAELDRDHAIGHAYLTAEGALTVRDLRHRWRHKIVPLLQEYFYADEDRLQSLLGEELYRDATGIECLSEQAFLQALKALCEPG